MANRTDLPITALPVASERALPAGTMLDDCQIEHVLAQGSFGLVYRAYSQSLKLHVAIKEYMPDALVLRNGETQVMLRLRAHARSFELGLQAFLGEAQTLARCEHPSLLRVDRILQRHGTAYRVMRYCPGPTLLAHRLGLATPPDEPALRAWLDGLLGALSALHDEGCVHASVAPGNILLLPVDRPLLLDFDAVRAALISDRTQGLMAALEPCFVPIEQRSPSPGSPPGPWTDLYSLAATLHFCIGGELPAPASGATAGRPFEPARMAWQRGRPGQGLQAPAWLQAIDACLAEAPQDRPQSVAQLRLLLGAPRLQGPDGAAVPKPVPAAPIEGVAAAAFAASSAPVPELLPEIEPVAAASPAQNAIDASHARVLADLDETFAQMATNGGDDASAAPARVTALASEPASAPAQAPASTPQRAPAFASESESGSPESVSASASAPVPPWALSRPVVRRPYRVWLGGAVLVALLAGALMLVQPDDGAPDDMARPVDPATSLPTPPLVPTIVLPPLPLPPTSAGSRDAGLGLASVPAAAPVPRVVAVAPRESDSPTAAAAGTPAAAPERAQEPPLATAPAVAVAEAALPAAKAPAVAVAPPVVAPPPVAIAPPAAVKPPTAGAPPAAVTLPTAGTTPAEGTTRAAVAPSIEGATSTVGTPPTARTQPTPRALCANRSGYALYQCMQTQCAKRSLAKHSQCQRLRQSQSLG